MWLNVLFITIGCSFWILCGGAARGNGFREGSAAREGARPVLVVLADRLLQGAVNSHRLPSGCNTSPIKRSGQSSEGGIVIGKECETSEPAPGVKEIELPLWFWLSPSCWTPWTPGPRGAARASQGGILLPLDRFPGARTPYPTSFVILNFSVKMYWTHRPVSRRTMSTTEEAGSG